MLTLMTKAFRKWASQEGLSEISLAQAATEVRNGIVDARLGGFLVKKRVARQGQGKRGSYRTILMVANVQEDRLVFMNGFAKNDRESLTGPEVKALKLTADALAHADRGQIIALIADGILFQLEKSQ